MFLFITILFIIIIYLLFIFINGMLVSLFLEIDFNFPIFMLQYCNTTYAESRPEVF
jgi:hypothetical protein